ncbi:MAG: hypothetical protein JWO81_3443, partial [Alphaproteobacteria bacterium]|nr:hypothetical protein [Alphaproteobacteria bacterium]
VDARVNGAAADPQKRYAGELTS